MKSLFIARTVLAVAFLGNAIAYAAWGSPLNLAWCVIIALGFVGGELAIL